VKIRKVLVVLTVLVLGAGVAAVARPHVGRHDARPAAERVGPNATRFLDLTGGTDGRNTAVTTADQQLAPPISGDYTPAGWKVTPAGQQIDVLRFPLGLTPTADGSHIVVSSDSGGMQGLSVIDTNALDATHTPAGNLFMGLGVTPSDDVYASGGNANRIFKFKLANGVAAPADLTEAVAFPIHGALDGVTGRVPGAPKSPVLDGIPVNGYPGGSVLDGSLLYIAGTLGEPSTSTSACGDAQQACSRITIVDTATDTVIARVPVGLDAYGLALDSKRHRLYVSNWADEAGRAGAAGGSVSVVDVSDPAHAHELGWTRVGHHPSALQLSADRTRLFVANTNDDSLSVLDASGAGAPTVLATESVRPTAGVPVGAHPDAFALSPDGDMLFVALAGLNAIEVRDGRTGSRLGGRATYIPTGVYPSALTITGDAKHYRLWIANAKGLGAGPGTNLSVGGDLNPLHGGTVSAIDFPVATSQVKAWSAQVVANDRLDKTKVNPCKPDGGVTPSQVLCPPKGKASPIKHVLYIVTENKTFDQYFGDVDPTQYDADPSYGLYGENFTPNHHAFVGPYSLSDRFFSDGEVSVTGHSWTSGAVATAHNEVTWQADYDEGIRGNHGNGDPVRPGVSGPPGSEISEAENELDDPEGGYIFEAFKRAGAKPPTTPGAALTMGIYGESTARESGDMNAYKAPGWKTGDIQYFDTCRAHEFIDGVAPDGPGPNSPDQFQDCGGRTLAAPFTLKHWTEVYAASGDAKTDVMPSFMYMSLPVNHTLGTNLGSPTPASMVADNDYAIGLIVEALSKSPFWDSTAVMITEDDTQAAGDHVSYLRDYLQVISPWAKAGANHQWGSMPSLLRTIETIFSVEPISLYDKLALPQHGAFLPSLNDKPNKARYTAIKPAVPFALNEPGAVGQSASMAMDWSTYDLIDEATLNAILYAVQRGTPLKLPAYAEKR
jgi:DNA-binding beta-propeller fold protein YncE